jgi:hypothetical protein
LYLPEHRFAKIWNLINDQHLVAQLKERLAARLGNAAWIQWTGHHDLHGVPNTVAIDVAHALARSVVKIRNHWTRER